MRLVAVAAVATVLLASAGAPAQSDVDFAAKVLPILERHCIECHRAPWVDERGRSQKPKAGLRLDGRGWIVRGGDAGAVVVAARPDESELLRRIALPRDDDDSMPPEGDPLTAEEVGVIRDWIVAGAGFGTWQGAPGPADDAPRNTVRAVSPAALRHAELARGLSAAAPAVIAKARGDDARIEPVQPDSPLLSIGFPAHEATTDDVRVAALDPLRQHVTRLDLGRTSISDQALASIGRMSRLTHLDLRRTPVTDRGIARLTGLAELRYLNLYGTGITDRGLDDIAKCRRLEAVYLWQTAVTPDGIARLRERLPDARIHAEPILPEPAGDDEAPRRRRRE